MPDAPKMQADIRPTEKTLPVSGNIIPAAAGIE
jgi:hypothetical protein